MIWVLILVGITLGASLGGGTYSDNLTVNGTEASTAFNLLSKSDRGLSGYEGLVVFHTTHGSVINARAQVDKTVSELSSLSKVQSVTNPLHASPPLISRNGTVSYIAVDVAENPKSLGKPFLASLQRATLPLDQIGAQVAYGGDFDQLTRPAPSDRKSELIGFAVALVVLLIGFGSVIGALLPLLTALVSVLIGVNLLGLVASAISFGTAAPTLTLMIGLGVGIDYALFLTTRFRQRMINRDDPETAIAEIVSTSGHAVLIAAGTVAIALLGLYVSGITFIGLLGFAAIFGVITAAAGAITLVPAALALLGPKVDRVNVRRPIAETGSEDDTWHRFAHMIGRRPWTFLTGGILVLALLAIPLLSIQIGHVGDGADPLSYSDKQAYDLISSGFGPGWNGPMTIVVKLSSNTGSPQTIADHVEHALRVTPDVAGVTNLSLTSNHALLVGTLIPKSDPQSQTTTNLFHTLISTTLPSALHGTRAVGYVTGSNASYIQFSDLISSRLIDIIAVVVATAFLLIMSAFRSLLLALKAALLNLVSISAAYGIVVAVFQWGWGRSLIGVSENVPIESYVPVLMFAIVFGLSMDYEIFLLSRVRETWLSTHDHRNAVATGLSSTGRVITCAALIMTSVFFAFVGSTDVVIKMLAVGLGSSVLIDATVVRLILVPSVMYLLGERSWWIPKWIDRVLPHIEA